LVQHKLFKLSKLKVGKNHRSGNQSIKAREKPTKILIP